jgi:hypothetical protein
MTQISVSITQPSITQPSVTQPSVTQPSVTQPNVNTNNKYKHILDQLEKYMFTNERIEKSIFLNSMKENKGFVIKEKEEKEEKINKASNLNNMTEPKNFIIKEVKEKTDIFFPKEKDTLFWCFYLIKYGDIKYEMSTKNVIEEKKIKIEYIEKMRENKTIIKKYKFATLTHIENQLANEMKIDLSTFFSLCAFENINVMYIHKKSYYDLTICEDAVVYVLHYLDNILKYGLQNMLEMNEEKRKTEINNYKTTFFKMETLDKPIKSVSSYKLSELQDFCSRLNIETIHTQTNKKKTKNELYESIIQYF